MRRVSAGLRRFGSIFEMKRCAPRNSPAIDQGFPDGPAVFHEAEEWNGRPIGRLQGLIPEPCAKRCEIPHWLQIKIITEPGHNSPLKARCWREANSFSSLASEVLCAFFSRSTAETCSANSLWRERGGIMRGNRRNCVMFIDAMPVVCLADFRKYFLPRWLPTSQFKNNG